MNVDFPAAMRRAARMPLLAGAVVAAAVVPVGAVLADSRSIGDGLNPDQIVDPVRATHGHDRSAPDVLVHTFRSANAFANGDLYRLTLNLRLSDRKASRPDRRIAVSLNPDGRTWRGVIRDRRDHIVGHANVWRPDDSTMRIEFSRYALPGRRHRYRWWLEVVSGCRAAQPGGLCGGPKKDRVPDRGTITHRYG